MKDNLFIRTLLIIIVTLLALNILLPTLSNSPTSYAAKSIEYKVINLRLIIEENFDNFDIFGEYLEEPIEKIFNEYGKEGWEFINELTATNFLIFKR